MCARLRFRCCSGPAIASCRLVDPRKLCGIASEHQGQIGLLLTDVIMPGMNGADLAHRLQSMKPGLITVFMSGYAENDVVRNMRRQSVIHIEKPFTVDILLSRIAEALGTEVRTLPTAAYPVFPPRDTFGAVFPKSITRPGISGLALGVGRATTALWSGAARITSPLVD